LCNSTRRSSLCSKEAIAATEARMREHAHRTQAEQLAAQEKKLAATHSARLQQTLLDQRRNAADDKVGLAPLTC
jgi:hypothetical protein